MKLCLLLNVKDGRATDLREMSLVGDDHQFGLTPDGKLLHYEGQIARVTPRGNGMLHVESRFPPSHSSDA